MRAAGGHPAAGPPGGVVAATHLGGDGFTEAIGREVVDGVSPGPQHREEGRPLLCGDLCEDVPVDLLEPVADAGSCERYACGGMVRRLNVDIHNIALYRPLVTLIQHRTDSITRKQFADDSHASKYLGVLDAHPDAFEHLLDLLNDSPAEHLLEHESANGNAALRGIVGRIEADPVLIAAVAESSDSRHFRQAVGVAIRLKMELLGWTTSGRKGPVGGNAFQKAEKYVRPTPSRSSPNADALAALDRIATIGSDEERRSTGERLDAALRATRAEQGRPY